MELKVVHFCINLILNFKNNIICLSLLILKIENELITTEHWLRVKVNYIVNFDINGEIFPIDMTSLVRKIKRLNGTGYYQDHFFVTLVKDCLNNRNNLTDSDEILAIRVSDGNPEHFSYMLNYLKLPNEIKDKIKLPTKNKVLLIGLLATVCYYDIQGLKELILEAIKKCVEYELVKLKDCYPLRQRVPVLI